MGASKDAVFAPEQQQIAKIAKAMGHPARVAILQMLLQQENCHCGGIVEELPLSQATVSQHLKELKEAGLIKGIISGPKICYCINEEGWLQAQSLLGSFLSIKPHTSSSCC